jgi:uncharacterized protein (TIGR00251 family)
MARPTRRSHDGARIEVRVKPRARESRVLGLREGTLEVAVAAAPVDGEANAELVRVLARHLGLPRSAVSIVSGASGRSKLIALAGLDETTLQQKLKRGQDPARGSRRR